MSGVFTIAPGAPFAETLAKGLIAREGPAALSNATIYLPTRRAARNFGDAFAVATGGSALLPQFKPLGDFDEDDLLFDAASEDLDLPPAIAPLRRQMLLAALIRRWDPRRGDDAISFVQAAALAESLGAIMDEIERQGCDLARVSGLAPLALAEHWQDVTRFLNLMGEQWPPLLAAEGAISAEARRSAALAALGRRLQAAPPGGPILAAGSTGSIPATAELIGVIARLPQGAVILPGLDRDLDEKSWAELDPGHPQFGLKQLLHRIGVAREAVGDWHAVAPNPRERLLRETLRPAPTTDAWRALAERGAPEIAMGLDGLAVVEADDAADEALVIALALRETLVRPGRTAALITPDRSLARRVAGELKRWKIEIDDSAGRPLSHTAAGSFLCLLAEAAGSGFAPVALLALLKHPFAMLAQPQAAFRTRARELDLCLRGNRPDPGLDAIAGAIRRTAQDARKQSAGDFIVLAAWWHSVAEILRPLETCLAGPGVTLAEALDCHGAAAERLASDETGAPVLWRGEDGATAAALFADLGAAVAGLPAIEASAHPALFRALAARPAVRATHGRHPRLSILGPLEARLQNFDLAILGGLNEGSWPPAAPADPWFSRPMRANLGLEQPERAIGLAAHDFSMLAAGTNVLLTRARKSQGAPAIRSRWLQRLFQLTQGLGLDAALMPGTDYLALAARMGEPKPGPRLARPHPTPPVEARPRRLSVTEIETWLRDPYAIYAKHVLGLRPLDELDEPVGPLERGNAIHRILELFVRENPGVLPDDAALKLIALADRVFDESGVPKAALALWRPRFLSAAHWFVATERERRARTTRSHLEIRGERTFPGPRGAFRLYGRADRIDELKGGGAAILDYKTGEPPSQNQVRELLVPQLPLEGAILTAGGFEGLARMAVAELMYVRVSGGPRPGEEREIEGGPELCIKAAARLAERIAFFDDPDTPYWPRVKPYRADIAGDYDHLARVREWSLAGWTEIEE